MISTEQTAHNTLHTKAQPYLPPCLLYPNSPNTHSQFQIKSKPCPPRHLISAVVPNRNLHLERMATIPQILRHQHGRLLTDKQRGAISVAADIIRTDGEVCAFEVLDAVDVEAGVEDAVVDYGVAVAGGHGAGAETYDCERERGDLACILTAGTWNWVKEGTEYREGAKDLGDARLTVPCSLHMTLNPFFNRGNVLFGVLEIFSDISSLAARDEAVLGRLSGLGMNGPATVLDAR